jgi:hypothetical protein
MAQNNGNGSKTKSHSFRVLILREGDFLIGQCLEYDIAVQARTMKELRCRLEQTFFQYVVLSLKNSDQPFSKLEPAPSSYTRLWEVAAEEGNKIEGKISWSIMLTQMPMPTQAVADHEELPKVPREAELALSS